MTLSLSCTLDLGGGLVRGNGLGLTWKRRGQHPWFGVNWTLLGGNLGAGCVRGVVCLLSKVG